MASIPGTTSNASVNNGQSFTGPLVILTSLFFMWGFITCLNDILIPHLKAVFDLTYFQVMLIQFCFFFAYFVVSLPSGVLVEKIGYKTGIVIGLSVAGLGCLLFYPAAGYQSYPLFLGALFVLASGITLLQVAANPYVAILGKPQTSSARLNLTQAFNSLGTTLAPYFGSLLILNAAIKTVEEVKAMPFEEQSLYRAAEAAAVQNPYLALASVLFLIAIVFIIIKLPTVEAQSSVEIVSNTSDGSDTPSAWNYSHLVLGAIGIFVYVGAEVSIGSFLVNYISLPEIAGISEADAGKLVSFYWGGAMIGRFIASFSLSGTDHGAKVWLAYIGIIAGAGLLAFALSDFQTTYIPVFCGLVILNLLFFQLGKGHPGRTLAVLAIGAILLVLTTMFTSGEIAMWSVLSIGLYNSIMFPTIFTLALNGLGKHTGQGSGILCMAIVGGAILPLIQGGLADAMGIQLAFFMPVLCYVFIAYYGWKGHIPKLQLSRANE